MDAARTASLFAMPEARLGGAEGAGGAFHEMEPSAFLRDRSRRAVSFASRSARAFGVDARCASSSASYSSRVIPNVAPIAPRSSSASSSAGGIGGSDKSQGTDPSPSYEFSIAASPRFASASARARSPWMMARRRSVSAASRRRRASATSTGSSSFHA